jgi:hypothetical protein
MKKKPTKFRGERLGLQNIRLSDVSREVDTLFIQGPTLGLRYEEHHSDFHLFLFFLYRKSI